MTISPKPPLDLIPNVGVNLNNFEFVVEQEIKVDRVSFSWFDFHDAGLPLALAIGDARPASQSRR